MRKAAYIFAAASAVYLLANCKGKDPVNPTGDGFDKEAMLQNIGENVIVASYEALQEQMIEVEGMMAQYETVSNEVNLNALRNAFAQAHSLWQQCSPFEFGPAADVSLRLALNTFPTDTARIKENVINENYTLDAVADADAKGFPAMEFLLYSSENADSTIAYLATSWLYFKTNFQIIKNNIDLVLSDWNNGYLNDFKGNTTSSVGSPIGMLVNQINFDFELLKNAKVGIPLGKKTLGITQPDKVESPFAEHSVSLIKANLLGLRNAFTGASGKGLDDYLDALGAKYNQNNLSTEIIAGFDEIDAILKNIDEDLAAEIASNSSELEDLYAAVQNLIVLLKVDMPSQLGVQITYQDNDGD